MASRHPGLEKADVLLRRWVHSLGSKMEKKYVEQYVLAKWAELVGDNIASNARPCGIDRGNLWVLARSVIWQNEIKYLEPMILDKINNCAGRRIAYHILFKRYHEDIEWSYEAVRTTEDDSAVNRRKRDIGGININEAELSSIRETCAQAEDEELNRKCLRAMLASKKSYKWRVAHKWHNCADCGKLCPEEDLVCHSCQSKREAEVRSKVRAVLMDMPWAHFSEIRDLVPGCTPYIVNAQRAMLVQKYAKKVKMEDTNTLDAKFLVMLYRTIQPEDLNEKIIAKALYALRGDLARPLEFKPLKRSEYMPKHVRKVRRKGAGLWMRPKER